MEAKKAESTLNFEQRKIKFASLLNRVETLPCAAGEEIYEWEYLDTEGNLKKDKRNVYEQIQSFRRQTNYKEKIARGEEFLNDGGVYMDTTQLGDDFDSVDKYLGNLVASVSALVSGAKSPIETRKDIAQNGETPNEGAAPPTEETSTTNPTEGGKSS